MNVEQSTIHKLLNGTKQYFVPLFQRKYTWGKNEWQTLWEDISVVCRATAPKDANDYDEGEDIEPVTEHFMGAVVNIEQTSRNLQMFILIDGQQRLTTNIIILCALHDAILERTNMMLPIHRHKKEDYELAAKLIKSLLCNRDYEGTERYFKLVPTYGDKEVFNKIIHRSYKDGVTEPHLLAEAYNFFLHRLRSAEYDLLHIREVVLEKLALVSVTLKESDNPYAVFESLNAKGTPLSQSDLIRNHLFMLISSTLEDQNKYHNSYWKKAEERIWKLADQEIGELKKTRNETKIAQKRDVLFMEFIRHALMQYGGEVRINDVYRSVKGRVTTEAKAKFYLKSIEQASLSYAKCINPALEIEHSEIRNSLQTLKSFEATTYFPLILNLYDNLNTKAITVQQMERMLRVLVGFFVRRFLSERKTAELLDTFVPLNSKLQDVEGEDYERVFIETLTDTKCCPNKDEIKRRSPFKVIYQIGKTKATRQSHAYCTHILSIVESYLTKMAVNNVKACLIIPDVPSRLNFEWKKVLGPEFLSRNQDYFFSLANVSLVPQGVSEDFNQKSWSNAKWAFTQSQLKINQELKNLEVLTFDFFEERLNQLIEIVTKVYPAPYDDKPEGYARPSKLSSITFSKPSRIIIYGESVPVNHWFECVAETARFMVREFDFNTADILQVSKLIGSHAERFRRAELISEGIYMEKSITAESAYKLCMRLKQLANLSDSDYVIQYSS